MKLRSRLIRPTGQLLEVCDPVENYTYSIDGVSVDDFTLPGGLVGIRRPRYEIDRLTDSLGSSYTLGL